MQTAGFDLYPGCARLRRHSKNCILSSNGEVFFLLTNPLMGDPFIYIARIDPATSCSTYLTDQEWKVLFLHTNKNKAIPKKPPTIGIAVIWMAKLGGYLARKNDGPPGTLSLWRGWKRLVDLSEGLKLAGQL